MKTIILVIFIVLTMGCTKEVSEKQQTTFVGTIVVDSVVVEFFTDEPCYYISNLRTGETDCINVDTLHNWEPYLPQTTTSLNMYRMYVNKLNLAPAEAAMRVLKAHLPKEDLEELEVLYPVEHEPLEAI